MDIVKCSDKEQGGNKSKNLFHLDDTLGTSERSFIIPKGIIFNPGDDLNNLFEQIKNIKGKLAIRSDSKFEDGDDDSGAGVFETILNVENNLDSIKNAISLIQKNAVSKIREEISILIMEMVEEPDLAGTIFGIDSRNGNKNSYTINYSNGLGTNVVDGTSNTKVQIVNKNFNEFDSENINKNFISVLIKSVKEIEKVFSSNLLDIEFAYKEGNIFILQVRPLTALEDGNKFEEDEFVERIFSILSKKIKEKDMVLGDMIDINPAELLKNTKSYFINTLFAEIFPKKPLKEAREQLGYAVGENDMYSIIFNKFFIDLEENILSFLPNTLEKEEKEIFIEYYKNLIKNTPSLQDKLDSIEYPNTIEIVEKVLNKNKCSTKLRLSIIEKFNNFFDDLENKLSEYSKNYSNLEENILKEIFLVESGKMKDISVEKISNISIDDLLTNIKEITKLFAIHARGAFYYRNEDISGKMEYFDAYKYSNQFKGTNRKFLIPNGFDIMDNIEVEFKGNKEEPKNNYKPKKKEIFELARDNLKFMFMILLAELGEKLKKDLKILGINEKELYNLSFSELIKNIDDFDKLKFLLKKRSKRSSKFENISSPSVIFKENLPGNHKLMTSGTYIGAGEVKCSCEYINDSKELYKEGVLEKLNGKILFLDTATPEIDGILSSLLNNVSAIVTKYGGPGAHITLRLREENKKRKEKGLDQIGLLVGLGDSFDFLKNEEKITLNFNNNTIG